MGNHAEFGASSCSRWVECPGSIQASRGIERKSSIYADEGTAAHELAERSVLEGKEPWEYKGEDILVDGQTFTVDGEMADAVSVWYDLCQLLIPECSWHALEGQVNLDGMYPDSKPPTELFGTADFLGYDAKKRRVIVADYKHGKGVSVEVDENSQFKYYGLGAWLKLLEEEGQIVEEVELIVCQPRAWHADGPVRKAVINLLDLMMWFDDTVRPAITEGLSDSPGFKSGGHCRFCPAKGSCATLNKAALEVARIEFANGVEEMPAPERLSSEQIGEILSMADLVVSWVNGVRAEASARADRGEVVSGWKLVDKRATRKWKSDDTNAGHNLVAAGLSPDDIFTMKLKTPPQIEKLVGKAKFKTMLSLVTKASSGTTLVPEDDKRPVVKIGPASDFSG